MSSQTLLERLGVVGSSFDARLVRLLIGAFLLLYAAGYAAFYPRLATIDDEGRYIEQTGAVLATGSVYVSKENPLTGAVERIAPGDYPMGMIALMAPVVAAFGWRGAFLPSFLCVLIAVLGTARWLRDERRSPVYVLILFAFPAVVVGGRLAMSDTARMAWAAAGLWLFFRGLDGERRGAWLASGFLAGSALTLRESAALPFVAFFAGSVLRRDRGWVWLLFGGLAGTAVQLFANQLVFGSSLFVRTSAPFYPLDLATIHQRLPLYMLGLLVLVPGGLFFGLAYRGRRRPEVIGTILLMFVFYLLQAYGIYESGFVKRTVVALRYFDPLLPLLPFAMAESVPRLAGGWLARMPQRPRIQRLAGFALALWIAGAAAAAFAVHPVLDRWTTSQAEIHDAIERHVPRAAVLIANRDALEKFIDDLGRPFLTLHRRDVSPAEIQTLLERHGGVFVALLDRSDSEFWREDAVKNAAFIEGLPAASELVADLRMTSTDRLRISRIGAPTP